MTPKNSQNEYIDLDEAIPNYICPRCGYGCDDWDAEGGGDGFCPECRWGLTYAHQARVERPDYGDSFGYVKRTVRL